jgi:type II pantothenate kinase
MRRLADKQRRRGRRRPRRADDAPSDDRDETGEEDGEEGKVPPVSVVATGGGAYKFYDKIRAALGVEVMREDEMECLIVGLDFFITHVPGEVFTSPPPPPSSTASASTSSVAPLAAAAAAAAPPPATYPYLLVNIGSGVSILKVTSPRTFERVGGTSLGGGTLWGLLALLTGARSFDAMLRLAERGDNTKVDMLVGDIYGADYAKIGLASSTIASSFGKVLRTKRAMERRAEDYGGMVDGDDALAPAPPPTDGDGGGGGGDGDGDEAGEGAHRDTPFRPEDMAKSLLYAVSNNIGQIAFLHAREHACERIYFGGSFIGGHWQTMATLAYAIRFWSKGSKAAYFLRHEGYLGAVGAFLKLQEDEDLDGEDVRGRREAAGTAERRRGSLDGLLRLKRVGTRE